MKRIYMVQPNSIYGNSIYFPYAAGSLIAFAFKEPAVRDSYCFRGFVYKKDKIEDVVRSVDDPFLVGFSCYLWNYEYNKALAQAIKKEWPDCIIVFGGHQVYRGSGLLEDGIADILQFGEGEETFRSILLALNGDGELKDIPNIAYRDNGSSVFTVSRTVCIPQRVSPYLEGWFDEILKKEKDLTFCAILETNRGCPNKCAFCDWGNVKSHVRLFDKELVKAEIDWFAEKKIDYVYGADGNFGLFPRDEEFVDYLILKHGETGYPQKFQTTFSKNNPDQVFRLNKKLNDSGMSKGATISFQSLSPEVLKNIHRQNLPLDHFKRLMRLYNENGIAAYSEIILGLPGETYESFREGLETLLESGQHMSIVIFNLELLYNSVMNAPEYIEDYGIKYSSIEQHQYHVIPYDLDIREYSRVVVSTKDMPPDRWIATNILGDFVRAFHNLGLLQCYAIYLFYEKGLGYTSFYEQLIGYAASHPETVCGKAYALLERKFTEILNGNGSLTWQDDDYGKLTWPLEEGVFLLVAKEIDVFRSEMRSFLQPLFEDRELFEDLEKYQNAVVKTPGLKKQILTLEYDWYDYFSAVYDIGYRPLRKKYNRIVVDPGEIDSDLPSFAEKTIWYGRKGGKNIATDIHYE